MAETSKNKIYYNDDENSVADVLTDMKKLAQSVDNAIEKSKYNDTQIKKDISNMKTEITAKDNTQDNKILKLQAEKAELEKELKEAREDFYQASIRGQASGEYIHVEDSSNCRAKIGIGGNQEQETRAGYNKLNMSNAKGGTSGGITCVINEDGSYQFKGTATTTDNGAVNVWFLGYYNSEAPTLFTLEAGTYYINDVLLFSGIKQLNKPLTKIYTFTSAVNITGVRAMSATPGQTYNEVKYPIIAKSDKELTWEQYGVSPSPDYLSKVVAVGGNVQLLDKNNANKLSAFINGDTKVITSFASCKTLYVSCVKNTYYTVKRKVGTRFIVGTTTNKPAANITCNQTAGNNTADSITIKTSNTDNYLVVFYYNSGSDTLTEQEILDSIKIVEGTEVGEYSKYGQGSVKVTKCNKNLFDENNKLMNATINSNGIIATGQDNYLLYFPVKYGHKYIFSTDFSESLTTNIVFGYCNEIPSIGVLSTYNVIPLSNLKNKIFTPIDEKNKYLCIRLNYKTQYNKMSNIQLEENTVSTSCKEHQEQSYIMPVQQEMLEGDYFDFDNEEEVHGWTKLVLTGNENWKLESVGRFGIMKSDLSEIPAATSSDNDYLGNMCNSYKESTPALTWKKEQGFCVDGTSCLRIYDTTYSSSNNLEGFKEYLKSKYDAGIPVMIYYKLVTPTRLKFTDEQKAVAKELNNARTYKNVTNITTDSKAILSLDYAKDLETLLTSKESEV